jgi:hypothetical protein
MTEKTRIFSVQTDAYDRYREFHGATKFGGAFG